MVGTHSINRKILYYKKSHRLAVAFINIILLINIIAIHLDSRL